MDSQIIIAFIIFIAIRIIAGLNIPILSAVLRAWWNISFKIAAFIPFCGWMTHLIITKGDKQAKIEKEHYVNIGRETDDATAEMLERSAERAKAEEAARQVQREQEEANRRALEEDLRSRAYNKYGTRDVHLNSDGSKVRIGDSDFVSTEEFKKAVK